MMCQAERVRTGECDCAAILSVPAHWSYNPPAPRKGWECDEP